MDHRQGKTTGPLDSSFMPRHLRIVRLKGVESQLRHPGTPPSRCQFLSGSQTGSIVGSSVDLSTGLRGGPCIPDGTFEPDRELTAALAFRMSTLGTWPVAHTAPTRLSSDTLPPPRIEFEGSKVPEEDSSEGYSLGGLSRLTGRFEAVRELKTPALSEFSLFPSWNESS